MIICAHIPGEQIHGHPLFNSLQLLAKHFLNDKFIVFTDGISSEEKENLICVPLQQKKIFSFAAEGKAATIRKALKIHDATFFISAGNELIPDAKTLPQYLFFCDGKMDVYNAGQRKKTARSLGFAKAIFTTEDFIASILKDQYQLPPEKIKTIYHGLPHEAVENQVSAALIKEKFTDGIDYYICPVTVSAVPHLTMLLKAFSLFKKRQKTSLMLVLLLDDVSEDELIPNFKNYKYREDVAIVSVYEKNAAILVEHGYAMIWLCDYYHGAALFSAMQNNVGIIAADNDINRSLLADAALFFDETSEDLSEKIQAAYKDEALKNNLINDAKKLLTKYSSSAAAAALYEELTK